MQFEKRQGIGNWLIPAFVASVWLAAQSGRCLAQGVFSPSAGPINSSMAGASTATAIDFGGSYWNPATISGLSDGEFLLGSGLMIPSIHMQSELRADSIGQFPPTNRAGISRSDSGALPNLATGFSFRLDPESPLTFGFGVFGLAGGGVNFAGSSTTPILTPRQPPNTFGVGPIYSNLSFLSLDPMVSYKFSDQLMIGGGPVISSGSGSFSPAFFAPNRGGPFGLGSFPAATNSRPFWGGGFQVGVYSELNEDWNLGFSYKSPIWQDAGASTRPTRTERLDGLGCRRACRRSSHGAWPTRACPRRLSISTFVTSITPTQSFLAKGWSTAD